MGKTSLADTVVVQIFIAELLSVINFRRDFISSFWSLQYSCCAHVQNYFWHIVGLKISHDENLYCYSVVDAFNWHIEKPQ